MKKLTIGIATMTLALGAFACGGGSKEAKEPEASPEAKQTEEGAPKKSLEKFEGNKMEKADEDE